MVGLHEALMDSPSSNPPGPARPFLTTLAAAQQGDKEAQETLFRWFYPQVQAMVHRSLSRDLRSNRPWLISRFSTGDVVQEVFRSLLDDLTGFVGKTEDAFVGYLYMVARNRLTDAIRFHEASRRDGRATVLDSADALPLAGSESPEAELVAREEAELFHELLQSFSEPERLLLRGRIEQGAEFQDLADQLGYSSVWAARRAFYAAQTKLLIRFQQRRSD
jgi:RNA polymerase sigma factor (sigma-70 family)